MISISKEEFQKIKSVLKQHDVHKAAIFGSFANGTATSGSDVDLLIDFSGEKSLLDLANLKIELEEYLNRKFDVLTYASIHPLLKKQILKEQQIIL